MWSHNLRRSLKLIKKPSNCLVQRVNNHKSFHSSSNLFARILATDKVDPLCVEIFQERGHEVDHLPTMSEDELAEVIHKYDGLVVRSATKVTKKILEAATSMRVVGRAGVGVDNVDIAEATKCGIMVMNTPDGNTISTAQLALSLLCNLARKLPAGNISVKEGKWDRKSFTGVELDGKTMGIIGCGRIGQHVAMMANGMGIKVVGYDPVMTAENFEEVGIKQVKLEELWELSDIITVHAPMTPQTKHILNNDTLEKCKDGVLIVNCARGGIVEESALLEALKSGKVAGAALDVYTKEPPGEDLSELLAHPNLICTPHLGASTEEAQINVAKDVAVQMCDVFDQKGYVGVLNVSYMAAATNPAIKPFMHLAETIGAMQAQMEKNKVTNIEISTFGGREVNITEKKAKELLQAKVLQGLVRYQVPEIVPDLISAPLIATEANIISSISSEEPEIGETYENLLKVTATREDGTVISITGAIFGTVPYIVHIDDKRRETEPFTFTPEGTHALMFENINKPGILKDVLKVIHNANVNVGSVNIAPLKENPEKAFCFMTIDEEIPTNAMRALLALPTLSRIESLKLVVGRD